jgi:hypothetical protein
VSVIQESHSVHTDKNSQNRALWISLAIVSAFLAISSWAVSSPVGSSPDDDFHLPSIWCGQGERENLCEGDTRDGWYQIPQMTMANSSCFAFQKDVSGACFYDNSLAEQFNVNLGTNLYPPVYYWVMSWIASTDVPLSTISIRVFNGALTVSVVVLLLLALPKYSRRAPVFTLILTAVPLSIFLLGSTNPSAWSYLGLLTLLAAFTGFLSVDTKRSKFNLGLLATFGFLMSVGSRADAAPFAALSIVLAWVLAGTPKQKAKTSVLLTVIFFTLSAVAFLGGRTAASVVSGGGLELPQGERPNPSFFGNLTRLPDLWAGAFGTWELGWLDTPLPSIVWFSTLGICVAFIFSSLGTFKKRQTIAFGVSLAALTAVPMYVLMSNGLSVGEQVQPRYLLPLIVFVVFTALYRRQNEQGLSLSAGQLIVAAAALVTANSVALHTNLRRYTTGLDVRGVNLDAGIEWWWSDFPISPNTVFVAGSLAFGLLLVSIWQLRITLGLISDNKKTVSSSLDR